MEKPVGLERLRYKALKACFINSFYSPDIGGGAEIILKNIVLGLKNKGAHVFVIATKSANDGDSITKDYIDGVCVYRIPINNFYWHYKNKPGKLSRILWHLRDVYNARMADRVAEILAIEKPNVISCHNLAGISVAVWDTINKMGIPFTQVLHDLYLACPATSMFKDGCACRKQCFSCKSFRFIHKSKSNTPSRLVGVSQFVVDRMKDVGYFKNVESSVINNARSIPDMPALKTSDYVVFGFLGSIIPSKGVEWLIDEFLRLNNPTAKLLIAGDGDSDYVAYLKSKDGVEDNKNIEFLGYIKPDTLFSKIHVLIVPSIWPDTFPGVAFESCGYHVPVIASNVGGLPEIVKDGVNGILCDPNKPNSLGAAMFNLAENKEELARLTNQARGSVDRLLDPDRMIDEHYSVLYNLATSCKIC